jgi:hypothetical protein
MDDTEVVPPFLETTVDRGFGGSGSLSASRTRQAGVPNVFRNGVMREAHRRRVTSSEEGHVSIFYKAGIPDESYTLPFPDLMNPRHHTLLESIIAKPAPPIAQDVFLYVRRS